MALIPAAGVGARMGGALPKQYMEVRGKSILRRTVDAFLRYSRVAHTYVVVSPDDAYVDHVLADSRHLTVLRCGGATRRDSVRNGLRHLQAMLAPDDWVLVHDAARPGLNMELLSRLIDNVGGHAVGGLLALPVVDTVKRVVGDKLETVARDGLWLAQTPQMFRYRLLCDALDAAAEVTAVTDESSAVEAAGYAPLLVEGHACNLKVTQPSDLELVQHFLKAKE